MTVEELIETLERDPSTDSWEIVNKTLPSILDAASGWYDEFDGFGGTPYVDYGVSENALQIALLAVKRLAEGVAQESAAKDMVDCMAGLAICLLASGGLDPETRIAVEKIASIRKQQTVTGDGHE